MARLWSLPTRTHKNNLEVKCGMCHLRWHAKKNAKCWQRTDSTMLRPFFIINNFTHDLHSALCEANLMHSTGQTTMTNIFSFFSLLHGWMEQEFLWCWFDFIKISSVGTRQKNKTKNAKRTKNTNGLNCLKTECWKNCLQKIGYCEIFAGLLWRASIFRIINLFCCIFIQININDPYRNRISCDWKSTEFTLYFCLFTFIRLVLTITVNIRDLVHFGSFCDF